jgi:hypothetical protein
MMGWNASQLAVRYYYILTLLHIDRYSGSGLYIHSKVAYMRQ